MLGRTSAPWKDLLSSKLTHACYHHHAQNELSRTHLSMVSPSNTQ